MARGPRAIAQPAGSTVLNVGDDLPAAVAAAAAGTKFWIKTGKHRLAQKITPKTNQEFYHELGCVLSGAFALTGWTASGSTWWATGQLDLPATPATMIAGSAGEQREDVFYDGLPLARVNTLAEVAAGKVFLDRAANRVYIGDTPTGHLVEQAHTAKCYESSASGVVIDNGTMEMCADDNGGAGGMIRPTGSNAAWTITNNAIRYAHQTCIGLLGNDTTALHVIRGNIITGGGGLGINGYRTHGYLVEDNEITGCNRNAFARFWEAGAVKTTYSDDFVIRGNWLHHNSGPHLWTDIDCQRPLIEDNDMEDGDWHGAHIEVTHVGTVRNNRAKRNAKYGIYIHASHDFAVSGNTAEDNIDGQIVTVDQDRSSDPSLRSAAFAAARTGLNNTITDNTMIDTRTTGARRLALALRYAGYHAGAITSQIFDRNTYRATDPAAAMFQRGTSPVEPFAAWQATGKDPNSTISVYSPPPVVGTPTITTPFTGVTSTAHTLAWSAAGVTGGTLGGHEIERDGVSIGTVPAGTLSKAYTGRTPGATYAYRVRGFTSGATPTYGAWSATASVTQAGAADTLAPKPPTAVSAVQAPAAFQIDITWTRPTQNTDNTALTDLAGFGVWINDVQHPARPGATATSLAVSSDGSGAPLAVGASYSVQVDAVDQVGNRSTRAPVPAADTVTVVDTVPPGVPTNLAITATSPSTVTFAADPATPPEDVAGYRVYLATGSGAFARVLPPPSDPTVERPFLRGGDPPAAAARFSVLVEGLTPETEYRLLMRAYDPAGNESGDSTVLTVTTDPTPAPTVQSLTVTQRALGDGLVDAVASAADPAGGTLTYDWRWGDGTALQRTSTGSTVHLYSPFGAYSGTLTVTSTSSGLATVARFDVDVFDAAGASTPLGIRLPMPGRYIDQSMQLLRTESFPQIDELIGETRAQAAVQVAQVAGAAGPVVLDVSRVGVLIVDLAGDADLSFTGWPVATTTALTVRAQLRTDPAVASALTWPGLVWVGPALAALPADSEAFLEVWSADGGLSVYGRRL